jgi:hypothetical protein
MAGKLKQGEIEMKRALNYLAVAACWLGIFGLAYIGLVLA